MSLSTGQIADVDFRFVVPDETTTKAPELQYRKLVSINNCACRWTPWTKVPLVVLNLGESTCSPLTTPQ